MICSNYEQQELFLIDPTTTSSHLDSLTIVPRLSYILYSFVHSPFLHLSVPFITFFFCSAVPSPPCSYRSFCPPFRFFVPYFLCPIPPFLCSFTPSFLCSSVPTYLRPFLSPFLHSLVSYFFVPLPLPPSVPLLLHPSIPPFLRPTQDSKLVSSFQHLDFTTQIIMHTGSYCLSIALSPSVCRSVFLFDSFSSSSL